MLKWSWSGALLALRRIRLVLLLVSLFTATATAILVGGGGGHLRRDRKPVYEKDLGKPLILTDFIKSGKLKQGRKASRIQGLEDTNLLMYSGYFTVNSTYNSNLFFWYIPAEVSANGQNARHAPLMVWLQGGPGASSLFALFVEHGPFSVDAKLRLVPRKYAWTSKYSMLYIDNPVGTGFSFTDNIAGYATNEIDVGNDLYTMLIQFFQIFPDMKNVDFYITGESYAGKYVPAIAHRIHIQDKSTGLRIDNFKGIAIGNGFTDPINMFPEYADYIYAIGLLDASQRDYFSRRISVITDLIVRGHNIEAIKNWDSLLNGDLGPSYFQKVTGCSNYLNFLYCDSAPGQQYYAAYLNQPAVRKAIHVADLTYHSGKIVEQHLLSDMCVSTTDWLIEIMENYKVCVYTGQLDIIVALPLTEAMMRKLEGWSGHAAYMKTPRQIWRIDAGTNSSDVAGYVRKVGQFFQILVRGGGHMLPADQPKRAFDMIDRFITDTPFF